MKKKVFAILGALFAIGMGIVGGLATGENPVKATVSAVVENMDKITEAVVTVSESAQEVNQLMPVKSVAEPVDKIIEAINILNATGNIIESLGKFNEGEPKVRDSPE